MNGSEHSGREYKKREEEPHDSLLQWRIGKLRSEGSKRTWEKEYEKEIEFQLGKRKKLQQIRQSKKEVKLDFERFEKDWLLKLLSCYESFVKVMRKWLKMRFTDGTKGFYVTIP